MVGKILKLIALIAAVLPPVLQAQAAVTASIDRADVEINESFTLKVTVDTDIDTEPDASGLEADFYVGQTSQLSNTTIINGQISRSRTWTYVLMPKRTGDLVIPPVKVGKEQSVPLHIDVLPQSNALPGEADIFVSAEVDHAESYVQAQVLYTVKVYRSVATRQPRLSEPGLSGIEVLVELAGEERSYESIMDGKNYNVVERVYALFPQESGELSIAPARFEARVLRGGRITGRKVFESGPITVAVNPIPAAPPEFPDAAWLPARSLELSEEWSHDPDRLSAGEPITRQVTITALGQLSTQLPIIDPAVSAGVKIYPDKPELRVFAEPDGIRAVRTDQYAMIGVRAGIVELPELKLPWWNIDEGEWQVASLPSRSLDILPSGEAAPPPQVRPPVEAQPATETITVESSFWRRVSEGLVALWVLTVFLWWVLRRPNQTPKEPEPPPIYKQQAKLLKAARRAAIAGDDATVKSSLLNWGRLEWPNDSPRSIGEIASRVSDPLAGELNILCSASYGPSGDSWNGEKLARALRSIAVKSGDERSDSEDELPPLMPGSPA
ncbi:MAG: BatD family protein [Woeseia sp.]